MFGIGSCTPTKCNVDINLLYCPNELAVWKDGIVIALHERVLVLHSNYSNGFKAACPTATTYVLDTLASLNYDVKSLWIQDV